MKKSTAQPMQPAIEEVELKRIDLGEEDRVISEEAVLMMAETLRQRGMLQPVVLRLDPKGTKYLRVDGRCRLLAAKQLGWKTVPAIVKQYDDDLSVEIERAVANWQRGMLSPAEESAQVRVIVGRIITRKSGEAEPGLETEKKLLAEAVKEAAGLVGKSERWVMSRWHLGRLDGLSRRLVLEGRLPLSFAAQIATLADPVERDSLAEMFASTSPDVPPLSGLDDVKREVARRRLSLLHVPWELDVPFADRPACISCPHNSANVPGLFEGPKAAFAEDLSEADRSGRHNAPATSKVPQDGVCLHVSCFRTKAAAANRAVSAAVRKTVKAATQNDVNPTIGIHGIVASNTPDFVSRSVVAKMAKAKIAEGEASDTPPAEKQRSPLTQPEDPTTQALRDYHAALREWRHAHGEDAIVDAIMAELRNGRFDMFLSLLLLSDTPAVKAIGELNFHTGAASRERWLKNAHSPGVAKFAGYVVKGQTHAMLAAVKDEDLRASVEMHVRDETWATTVLASMCEQLPPSQRPAQPPTWADFDPARKAKAAKAAEKAAPREEPSVSKRPIVDDGDDE